MSNPSSADSPAVPPARWAGNGGIATAATSAHPAAPAIAHPAVPGWGRLVLIGVLCAALQALQPAYMLGMAPLSPLPLALAVMAAAAMGHGRWMWAAAALGTLAGAWTRAAGLWGGDGAQGLSALMTGANATGGPLAALLQGGLLAAEAGAAALLLRHGSDADRLRLDTSARLRRLVGVAAPAGAALGVVGAALAAVAGLAGWTGTASAPLVGGSALGAHLLGRFIVDLAALVLGPAIGLCWLGRAGDPWPARRRLLAWPLLGVLVLLLGGLDQVARRDERRLDVRFAQESLTRQNRLQSMLAQPVAAVVGARGMLAVGGERLTPAAFDGLATIWTNRELGLLALGWLEVERAGESAGTGDAAVVPSTRAFARLVHAWRPFQAPPVAVVDAEGHVADAALRRTVAAALTADGVVSGVLDRAGPGERPLVAIAQAVRSETGSALPGAARVAFALVDPQRQLAAALPVAGDPDLRVCVFDAGVPAGAAAAATSAGTAAGAGADAANTSALPAAPSAPTGSRRILAGSPGCADQPALGAIRMHAGSITLPGRALTVLAVEPPTADNRLFTAVWLLGLPSVMGLAALATLLLTVSGRMRRIEARVNERTAELQAEVAERREAQAALTHSEQRFRAIFEGVNIGITLVDRQGRLLMVNPAFCQMMGCQADELLGRQLSEFLLPDTPDDDGTARAVAGEGARRQRYLTPDGRMLHVAASVRELHDSLGELTATAAALHDLTPVLQRREAERAREQADIANRTKSEFLASLSHELRAPLQAILGFTQMLDETPLDAQEPSASGQQLQRTLSQIRKAGWHVLDMVNDVLDLSRLESGSLRLELAPVSTPEVVQESVTMIEAAAARAQVPIGLSLSPQAEWAMADALRLRQILVNLIGNAVRYNRPGGRVEVRTRPGDLGEVRIDVEDTGVGIAASQLDELFRPFHRLGRGRDADEDQPEGAGVGLAISRRLAAQMNGRLEVVSQPGEGSVFSLFLPSAQGPDTPRVELTGAMPLTSQVTIGTVLCIDDDPADIATVQRLLGDQPGLTLLCALTGTEGLEMGHEADVVLLDLDLPDLPGIEVMRRLHADTRFGHLPVIVVSAETRPDRIDACFDAGATAFLPKPLEAGALLRAVQQAIA